MALMHFLRRARDYASLPTLALGVLTALTTSILEAAGLAALLPILEKLGGGEGSGPLAKTVRDLLSYAGLPTSITWVTGLFIVLFGARAVMAMVHARVVAAIKANIALKLRLKLYKGLMESRWEFLIAQNRSQLANALVTEANRCGEALYHLFTMVTLLIMTVAFAGVIFSISPAGMATVIGFALFAAFATRSFARRAKGIGHKATKLNAELQQHISITTQAGKLIRTYRLSERYVGSMNLVCSSLANNDKQSKINKADSKIATETAAMFGLFAVTILLVHVAGLALAEVLTIVVVMYRMVPTLSAAQQAWLSFRQSWPAAEKVLVMLDDVASNMADQTGGKAPILKKNLCLKNVTYKHLSSNKVGVFDLSINLKVGGLIAVVGPSGAGKSTLADLLLGLHVAQQGEILVDGYPLEERMLDDWRNQLGYVPQDPIVLPGSIRSNLLIGRKKEYADDDVLWEALESVAMHDKLRSLPKGMDTRIGDGGMTLSGGEIQRLSLARALISEPALLILDEPTSALDVISTEVINQTLFSLRGVRTTIVVTHRLSMLEHADQIIVLESGRVREFGTWRELRNAQSGWLAGLDGSAVPH